MLIAAQKRIPPGTEPVFAPPDMLRKEAAIRDHTLGYRPPTHRQRRWLPLPCRRLRVHPSSGRRRRCLQSRILRSLIAASSHTLIRTPRASAPT